MPPIRLATVRERWWIMRDPIHEQPWEARMAYKKGWEVRISYYDRLLRSLMELIEGALDIMKVDEMSEVIDDLSKALLAIEDAWTRLAVQKTLSLVASEERVSE